MDVITLRAGEAVVDVAPAFGGRVAQISVRGTDVLVSRDHSDAPIAWSPMVTGTSYQRPWNRNRPWRIRPAHGTIG